MSVFYQVLFDQSHRSSIMQVLLH